jgi:hypothetical protein
MVLSYHEIPGFGTLELTVCGWHGSFHASPQPCSTSGNPARRYVGGIMTGEKRFNMAILENRRQINHG